MSAFPLLKTGAVAQYPAQRTQRQATVVHEFVDGQEQRFAEYGAPLRRWVIRLEHLEDAELFALERFFLEQGGAGGHFEFTDPWTEAVYPDCSFESDVLDVVFEGFGDGRSEVVVRENR